MCLSHVCVYMCLSFGTILHIFSSDSNTCSMEQSPSWEANRFSTSQGIPRILWNANNFFFGACSPWSHALRNCDFYFNLVIIANFHRFSEAVKFFVVTMIRSRLGNMSRLSWMLPVSQSPYYVPLYIHLTFRRRIKSRLPFAGIIRSSPYSTRFQDKG